MAGYLYVSLRNFIPIGLWIGIYLDSCTDIDAAMSGGSIHPKCYN